MSIKIMTAVWEVDLPDSDKLVLLALADSANDEGVCWPSMASLAKKCSKTDRTVQAAIKSLVAAGHLSRQERLGRGVLYTVHPRSDCTPEAASPPKGTTPTPEAASDKPSRTIIPQKATPSSVERARKPAARGSRLPADWTLLPEWRAWAAAHHTDWPPGRIDAEAERFADHWLAQPGSKGLKADWFATWRTWCRNSERFDHDRQRSSPAHASRYPDGIRDPVLRARIHGGLD